VPKGIDVHVHFNTKEYMVDAQGPIMAATAKYFKLELKLITVEEQAELYQEHDIMGVLLGWDAETTTGFPKIPNEYVADAVRKYPKTFLGFAGVDPWKKTACRDLEYAVKELGMVGVKFHQSAHEFYPDDHRFYPLWEQCQELGIVVLFHCGTTGLGAGAPGGSGVKLKYIRPMPIDEVAADFPELTIICAHPAWPWTDEAIAIAVHKANVYVDLSGWSPKYFPPQLVREVNTRLQDKALFGTDYPFIHPGRWLADFASIEIKDSVRPKVLSENARRCLKLP